MKHINKILVISELNRESYEALFYGITLSLLYNAEVSCLHLIKSAPFDIFKETLHLGSAKSGDALLRTKEENQHLLNDIIDVIAKELGVGEVEVNLEIVNGRFNDFISRYPKLMDADIIIIGIESGNKFFRKPHANLAMNIIKLEKANVLLVPSGFRMERIEQYGAFINFEDEEIDFIHKLIKHSSNTDNPVKLIHVIESDRHLDNANTRKINFEKRFAKQIREGEMELIIEIGPLVKVINSLKNKHNIDLMVLHRYHNHNDMDNSSSSFSDKVIINIKCPLMIWKTTRKVKRIMAERNLMNK